MNSDRNDSQGTLANRQGRSLESIIVPIFITHGFDVVSYRNWFGREQRYGGELLIQNVPYTSIYGHKGKTEFLLISERLNLRIRIECKWQQSSGSVDEKYPYLYLNCIYAMPEKDIMIVYGGGGMKLGSTQWLKNAATSKLFQNESCDKNILVYSVDEFMQWANRALRR